MTRQKQEGYLYAKGGYWYVRIRRDEVGPDGRIHRQQRAFRLVEVSADYLSEESVEPLRDDLLAKLKLNSPSYNVHATMTLEQFFESYFLPQWIALLKPSVQGPYEYNWRKHLAPLCGRKRLCEFKTGDGQDVIRKLGERGLARATVKHMKSLLSGVFREASRLGVLDGRPNPMREVELRKHTQHLRPPEKRDPYRLDEIKQMLFVLPDPARAVVAVCAFAGLRKGEVEALRCEHWHDGALWIEQSHWRGYTTEPKSEESKAPVPVIAPLAEILEAYGKGRTDGLVFRSERGTPLRLDNLARRVIRPTLKKARIAWRGYHCFRHGLATLLNQLGVDKKTIQAILRHADPSTTERYYIHQVPEAAREAMGRFEQLVCTKLCTGEETRVV